LNFQVGTVVGPFRLEAELGRGGMGVVFQATDVRAGRSVALKVVLRAQREVSVQRFVREAQVVAALKHPGIVAVHDALVLEGVPCIVYELVEGGRTLDQAFRELTLAERLELVLELADALAHVHEQGLLHRDVKPGNVLVNAEGRARLTDFGLVAGAGLERLTLTGRMVGTPGYMAPEQMSANREGVGAHSDVWSLGVILYEALTGKLPFEGDTVVELAVHVLQSHPARPSSMTQEAIPAGAEAVCLRALTKSPGGRYADARAFHAALASVLAGTFQAPSRLARLAGAAAALALVGGLGVAAARWPGSAGAVMGGEATSDSAGPKETPRSLGDWRRRALLLAARGKSRDAIAALTHVLAADARDTQALRLRGELLQELGEFKAALRDLEACGAQAPEDAELYYRIAVARWELDGQSREAPDLDRDVVSPQGLRYRGTVRYLAGQLADALADYTLVVERLPEFAPAHHARGKIRERLGDLRGALEDFDLALKFKPTEVRYLAGRARCLLVLARPAKALADIRAGLKLDDQNQLLLECLVWARRSLKDYEGAAAALERGFQAAPDSIPLLYQQALLHEVLGRNKEAIAVYQQVLVLEPRAESALLNLAVRHLALDQLDQVEAPLRKILAHNPHHGMALANLSSYFQRMGRFEESVEMARRATDAAPEKPELHEMLALALNGLKKHDQALAVLERLLEDHPRRARAHYFRSMALFGKSDFQGALRALDRALAIEPDSAKYALERAQHRSRAGHFREAAADYGIVIAKRPTPELYTSRGYARIRAGDRPGALADFERAITLDPKHEQALVNRSLLYKLERRFKESLADLDHLVKIAPKQSKYYCTRGMVRHALGDIEGCLRDFQRNRQLAPTDPDGPVLEGRAWMALGNPSRANTCFDEALAMRLNHVEALNDKAKALVALQRWADAVRTLDRLIPLFATQPKRAAQARRLRGEAAARLR
jgi:tetratricopeptide (TPR) repeat protein